MEGLREKEMERGENKKARGRRKREMREIGWSGEKGKKGEEGRKRELSLANTNLERFSSLCSFSLNSPSVRKRTLLFSGQCRV